MVFADIEAGTSDERVMAVIESCRQISNLFSNAVGE
jgi:hypothetical protein